jgi:hypothetical protein
VRTRAVLLSLCGVVGFEIWGSERWNWGIVDSYIPSHVSGLASRSEAEIGCRLPDSALVRCDDGKQPNAGVTGDGSQQATNRAESRAQGNTGAPQIGPRFNPTRDYSALGSVSS